MTVKTNAYIIGLNSNDSYNFFLDTDTIGGLRIRSKSDGSGSSILTPDGAGGYNLSKSTGQSMIRLTGANGYGSQVSNKIRRFLTVTQTQGTDITYLDDTVNGAKFTINIAGVYSIIYSPAFSTSSHFGLTLNESAPTTGISSMTVADILCRATTGATDFAGCATWVGYLPVGSIVRPHTNGDTPSGTVADTFTICRVS